ncbi:MAG: hypothetical protein KatS3mg087_0924 [Patescibacteria group bacterium]|nr:MAG: hypothetical protein KatS3mg087_0924 [Patescibacteria group bacterium]
MRSFLFGLFLPISILAPALTVVMGYAYSQAYHSSLMMRDLQSVEAMSQQVSALERLRKAQAYVYFVQELGLETEEMLAELDLVKTAYAQERFEEVNSDRILEIVAQKIDQDERKKIRASAKIEVYRNDLLQAKKSGVKVDDLEKRLIVLEELVNVRKYDDVGVKIEEERVLLVKLVDEKKKAEEEAKKRAAASAAAAVAAQNNGGITYERKGVDTPRGRFTADILRIDMSRSWVRTFTAFENDCAADCAVKPLGSYVGENGGVAGINGTYFCPPDYAQCAGKKNSFDLLVFDYRSKKYLNSGNNQYSTNPLVNFYPGRANFYGQASGFGRDTGASGVISNFPALISNGTIVAGDTGKGTRGGIGFNGNVAWAIIVRQASFVDLAHVFAAVGANNAMNLDGGGSSAMFFSGAYRVGPGRQLPNAIVFGN